MMIGNIWDFLDNFLAELDLSYLLILIVNELYHFVCVYSHSKVVHVEASVVLFEMDLIVTSAQVAHQVSESISIVEKLCVH